jgi:hypothetical protein
MTPGELMAEQEKQQWSMSVQAQAVPELVVPARVVPERVVPARVVPDSDCPIQHVPALIKDAPNNTDRPWYEYSPKARYVSDIRAVFYRMTRPVSMLASYLERYQFHLWTLQNPCYMLQKLFLVLFYLRENPPT